MTGVSPCTKHQNRSNVKYPMLCVRISVEGIDATEIEREIVISSLDGCATRVNPTGDI